MQTTSRFVCMAAGWGLAVLLLNGIAYAQFRAGIQGTIKDASGATVLNAKLTLTSEETKAKQETHSGADGFYRFSQLAPGAYTVTAELAGFQQAVKEHINVPAEEVVGADLTLTPGEITESVTVSAANAPALETENANLDGTITDQQVQRLPQVGRDPYELLRITPGVFGQGARNSTGGSVGPPNSNCGPCGSNTSIYQTENVVPIYSNGQRVTSNSFEIDGVNVNSQTWGGAAVVTPSQETVKEIHVVANSYSAETRSGGVAVQVVSQNGTNEFHGSGFFKYDSPSLDAFPRWGGPHGEPPTKNTNLFRQGGGSVGGPVIKNHLFFYFGYETLRQSSNTPISNWVETQQFDNLVQSARPNSIAAKIVGAAGNTPRIAQSLNGTCSQLGLGAGQCQAVPGGLDIGSPFGAAGQLVPNSVGGGLDGIPDVQYAQVNLPGHIAGTQYFGRLDFQATQKDRITFSEYFVPFDSKAASGPAARPNLDRDSGRTNLDGAIVWTRTLSPTMINEARLNATRWTFDELSTNPQIPWGIPQDTITYNTNQVQWGPGGPGIFSETTFDFRDTFSKVLGTHALRLGLEITKEQNNDVVAGGARPSYDFANVWGFMNDAPLDETGNFDPRNGFPTDLNKYIRTSIYSWFIQDDWKVKPNLTLNIGLRWDYYSPITEKYGNISNVILGSGADTATAASMRIGGQLWKPDKNNLAPQFGFAWTPKGILGRDFSNRLVVRGGFGIGYNRVPESVLLSGRQNPPFSNSPFLSATQAVYGLSTNGIQSFYGWPQNPSTVETFDPVTHLPVASPNLAKPDVFGVPQNFPQPYMYRYSLQLQYDLGHSWIATAGYQGSTGHKFERQLNYNLFYPANPVINNFTVLQNDVNSNFNALLLTVEHRFAAGFQMQAQYRFSKSIDSGCSADENCPQPWPFDQRLERGPSDFDVTHYFVASAVWDLPILRRNKGWAGRLLGGWELNGILTANSGYPWTPVYNDQSCVTISGLGGLCPVLPVGYLGGAQSNFSTSTFQQEFGNFPGGPSKYFVAPPGGTVLVPPAPGVGRNVFRGPHYFSTDMSAVKRIDMPFIRESASLELRANAFNIFNKLNLANFSWNSTSTQINSPDFGRALQPLSGRVIELQARFSF